MAYTQKTESNSRWRDFKLEICFEWGTTGISIRPYTVFNIYINDLEDNISSKVLKFADDTKVFSKVTNDTDKQSLYLDKLVKWSEKWQMLFNFGKCKCIHIGHGNMDEGYKMGDAVLGRTTQEKDLGVTFSADTEVSEQWGIAASKGNKILGLIRRTIMYKEKQLIVPLYKAIDHIWNIVFKHGGRIVKRT